MKQLRELDASRRGEATLQSISPGELRLRISSLDRAGHLGIEGEMLRYFYGSRAQRLEVLSVKFGCIEFDPGLLPRLVAVLEFASRHSVD
jgi:hypothetical protein